MNALVQNVLAGLLVAAAFGWLLWRRFRPKRNATLCAGCDGCPSGPAAPAGETLVAIGEPSPTRR